MLSLFLQFLECILEFWNDRRVRKGGHFAISLIHYFDILTFIIIFVAITSCHINKHVEVSKFQIEMFLLKNTNCIDKQK